MRIPLRTLWHGAVKLLLLCPILIISAWESMLSAYGEPVNTLDVVGFWPHMIYISCSRMTMVAIPLLGGGAALLVMYLRARSLHRIVLLYLLLYLWLSLLPWVMHVCFWTIYYFRN